MRWVLLLALPLALGCPSNSSLSTLCACDPNSFNGVLLDCTGGDPSSIFRALREHKAQLGLIQQLAIRNTSLGALPDDLFKGLYIKKLELTDNQITSVSTKAFSGLENILQSLSLRGNLLERVPSDALEGMSALLALDLSYNQIADITMKEALESLPKLYDLNLGHNRICDIYKGAFDAVKHSVQTLNLGYNCLPKVPAPAIRGFRQLLALHLDHNAISFVDPLHFMNLPGLNLLNLAGNGITGIHRMAFLNVPNLRLLYLADNNFTELKSGEFGHYDSLEMLDLTRNNIRVVPEAAFANMSRLSQLYLGENGIEEIGENAFANASLTMLLLPYNKLHHIGSASFQWMHNLQQLSLKNNSISSVAQNAFYHMPSLVMVDLSHNRLSELLPGTFLHQLNLFLVDLGFNKLQLTPYNAFNQRTATVVLKENPLVCTERVHLIQKGQGVFVPDTVDVICGPRPPVPAPPRVPVGNTGAGGINTPMSSLDLDNPFVQATPHPTTRILPNPHAPRPEPGQKPIIRPIGGGPSVPQSGAGYRPLEPATISPAPALPPPNAALPFNPDANHPVFIGPQAHFNGFQPPAGTHFPQPPSPDTWGKENLIPSQASVFSTSTQTPAPERRTILPFPVPFLRGKNLAEANAVTALPSTTPAATLPPGIVTASRGPKVQTGLPTWTDPRPKTVGANRPTTPVRPETTPFPIKTVPPKKPIDFFGHPGGSEPAIGNFDPVPTAGPTTPPLLLPPLCSSGLREVE